MKYKLLEKTEQYFDNEAKRIINIIYDENNQFGFGTKDMLKHLDVRIKEYYIHIELRMFGYNEAKKDKEDLSKYDYNLDKVIGHYKKYIQYIKINKKYLTEDFIQELYLFAKTEILNEQIEELLFKIFLFSKQNIKEHWDTVDCMALICLLDENFIKE